MTEISFTNEELEQAKGFLSQYIRPDLKALELNRLCSTIAASRNIPATDIRSALIKNLGIKQEIANYMMKPKLIGRGRSPGQHHDRNRGLGRPRSGKKRRM